MGSNVRRKMNRGKPVVILFACLLASCLPPTTGQPPMGDRYLGTFEAIGDDFREVVRIYEENGLKFEHTFYREGKLVHQESGDVKIEGYNVVFPGPFTVFVDDETSRPLTVGPPVYRGFSYILLREGEPELDRLLPFAENRYNLAKVAE